MFPQKFFSIACAILVYAAAGIAQRADRLEHALELLRQGYIAQARAELEVMAGRDPSDLRVLAYLANAEMQDGDTEQAVKHARRLVEAEPDNTDFRAILGETLASNAEWALAERECRIVAERRPGSEGAHFELARVLLQLGRFEDGLAEVSRSLEINPNRVDARALKGNLLASMGKMEEAVREWNQVMSVDANNAAALSGLAVYWKNSNPDFALEYARRAVELTKWQSVGSIRVLALVYRARGEVAKAREVLEKAVQKFPESEVLAAELRSLTQPASGAGAKDAAGPTADPGKPGVGKSAPGAGTPLGDVTRSEKDQKGKKAEPPPAAKKQQPFG